MTSGEVTVAGLVLLVVALVGVVAGRAGRRWSLLLAGLVAVVALGVVATGVTGGPAPTGPGGPRAGEIARLYTAVVPLVVAFGAGWLCGRGTWFRRLLVLAVAALLLAVFPYAAAGQATVELLGA